MTKEQMDEFKEVIKPVKDWADINLNPNQAIIIEHGFAKVVSLEIGVPLKVQD